MTNPLLIETDLPPFADIQPEHIEPAIDHLIGQNLDAIETLLDQQKTFKWENLVMPLEELDDRLNKAWSCVSHLNSVANTPALRQAYNQCLPKLSDYSMKVGQNQRLYQAYVTLQQGADFAKLTREQQKVITNAILDFELAGVALPVKQREHFAKLNQSLTQLQSKFQDNVMDATDHWHLDLSTPDSLAGIPAQSLELAKAAAHKAGKEGWRLTLDYPCFHAVITYADNRELRQKLHQAYFTRASELSDPSLDNTALMEKIVAIRHEMAKMLDFANYAERSLRKKMAKDPAQVLNFLQNLAVQAKPFAQRDYEQLCAFAKAEYGVDKLEPWDIAYYSEKFRLKNFALSQEELRPYFPVTIALEGMFEVVHRLYGLSIKEAKAPCWHEDVRFFEIFDEHQNLRGKFYLDLYARNHKRGGAWMDEARVRRRRQAGDVQLPMAFLTCNFRPAAGNVPALLTHDEVLTLFHEFGHGLHHLLTKMEWASISGINGVAWDAVELPSQFMENWCWQKEALAFLSKHYQTQDPLPEALLTKLQQAKNFQAGMQLIRQLEFSLFDFRLHLEFDPTKGARVQEILDEVRALYSVVPVAPYSRFQHSFGHIFSGGYAAGYYSYLWAEVLSDDAFARFEEEGVFNPVTGRDFLQKILERGGSEEAEILFRDFRGRDPDITALLRSHGLVN